jgi:hypothetical protein
VRPCAPVTEKPSRSYRTVYKLSYSSIGTCSA